MPSRHFRIPIRRLVNVAASAGADPLQASSAADNEKRLEVVEQQDVAAILELQRDGSFTVRLFGGFGASPLESALVRIETASGRSLTGDDARAGTDGRVTLTLPSLARSNHDAEYFLIVTIPAEAE